MHVDKANKAYKNYAIITEPIKPKQRNTLLPLWAKQGNPRAVMAGEAHSPLGIQEKRSHVRKAVASYGVTGKAKDCALALPVHYD
ncbi:hypothetical protein [Pseudanabaena sp. FACHB-2040]|uniref:hypothetical protein n=1 Tax=Pseudanabaena sp. FACHB-2040 TaxID=2692859 RepID=UPI001683E7DA|nr:hypothetical protein [Pseudanabaena sp. FACHB-2040]MBD2256164.1 hypothetical protein [Pseudanabaena sp. FACHB-2040]